MKVELIKEKEEFKPFKLEFNVETEQQAYALMALSLTNDSVPEVVNNWWGKPTHTSIEDIRNILRGIELAISPLNLKRYR